MGFFDDFVENMVGKLEDGLDTVENLIDNGVERAGEAADKLEQGAQKIVDVSDQAIKTTDKLAGEE